MGGLRGLGALHQLDDKRHVEGQHGQQVQDVRRVLQEGHLGGGAWGRGRSSLS